MKTLETAQVLFVKEVAEIMRMSPATVYKAIHRGELKAERYGTNRNSLRIDRKDFEEWRKMHRIAPLG